MAVSRDGAWCAVSYYHVIRVYSTTPPHALLHTIGSPGNRQLDYPYKMCVTPVNSLLLCDYFNNRVQELTLEGTFVRAFAVRGPICVALNNDVLAVGTNYKNSLYIRLFSYPIGTPLRSFGPVGSGDGQIGGRAEGMRFTQDGRFLVVAENKNRRVSVFTVDGEFAMHIGVGVVDNSDKDVEIDVNGDIIVADSRNHRVCVFPFEGGPMSASWGVQGTGDGQFEDPSVLALEGSRLYVLDRINDRVQVFE